jgi:hypothetical protein
MFGADDIRKAQGILAWINNLGADDTAKIKGELSDLVFHATASLKTILEIIELLENFDADTFDPPEFKALYQACRRFYLDPDALNKCRTHCSDLHRDADRIDFKLAKVGRTEGARISELNGLISEVAVSEDAYLQSFDVNIKYLENTLNDIRHHVDNHDTPQARDLLKQLLVKMTEDLSELRQARDSMLQAENKIRRILT